MNQDFTSLQNSLQALSNALAPAGVYESDIDHNAHVEAVRETDQVFGERKPEQYTLPVPSNDIEKEWMLCKISHPCRNGNCSINQDCKNPACNNYLPF